MKTARLTFASTDVSADAYYIAGMHITDAFVGMEMGGKYYALASSLELGNFKKYSRCDKVFSVEELMSQIRGSTHKMVQQARLIAALAEQVGADELLVGQDFPTGLYLELKKVFKVSVSGGVLFAQRDVKNHKECAEIAKANAVMAKGFALISQTLRQAVVKKGKLWQNKQVVTSESLRSRVQELFLREGVEPVADLIIAGGVQACDPHCQGFGPLKPNELIVVDLFAPLMDSHYWGDMSRTYLKGTPSDAQADLVKTVHHAQKWAMDAIKPGVQGDAIHKGVQCIFEACGYETKATSAGYVGFFHGTGHSLGLECHDNGRDSVALRKGAGALQSGNVVTVEPGLYYPQIGGCRIEDNGVVTAKGFTLLSHAPYKWVL